MCSPRPEISVTAADYRKTVHGHQSQQRSIGVGQWRVAPLDKVSRRDQPLTISENQSEWGSLAGSCNQRPQSSVTDVASPRPLRRKRTRRRFLEPQAQLSSHLPLLPTQAATWDYSQTLNKDLARSRSSRSAVSAIIPSKG
jgi:hypothetical protein